MPMVNMFWCFHSWTSIQKKGKILQIPLWQGGVNEAKKVWSLCFILEVFIWRPVVYVPKSSTTFHGILICVIFRPRDMQEYYMLFGIFTGDTGSYSLSVFYILLSRFPIPACLFILCIASLGIFYKRLSWNSHFTSTDHIYLWCNRSFKEYLKLLNRLYDITWFGSVYA
jgi:hypothetical protein